MIDARTVRIGNYVYDKNWEAFRPLGATDIYNMAIKGNDFCDAIDLTPEWLEKMGFVKEKSHDIEERDVWSIQVANNTSLYYDPLLVGKSWYLSLEWNNNHSQNEIWAAPKHVHQVQNLFYSLAGEELTIKL